MHHNPLDVRLPYQISLAIALYLIRCGSEGRTEIISSGSWTNRILAVADATSAMGQVRAKRRWMLGFLLPRLPLPSACTSPIHAGRPNTSWQSLIREVIQFAPAFHINILNPLQGAAGFGSPINIWADPVYWPFFADDPLFATQGSTLVAYTAIATSIFALSRI
jgi:hypothetical protein